jgi:hypothetical protein
LNSPSSKTAAGSNSLSYRRCFSWLSAHSWSSMKSNDSWVIADGPVEIIIVLLILALIVLLIHQNSLPWYKQLKLLPILKRLKAILDKVKAGRLGGLDEADRKELKDDVEELLRKSDDVKIEPKNFTDEQKAMIRELLKTLEEAAKSPNLPDDLKKAVEKLIEKLKPLK